MNVWDEQMILNELKSIIPKLSHNLYKGQCGKVAIIGGCFEYTGAPYYAGISSLKTGGDLCHVICSKEAAIPIKCYTPELIVHSLLISEMPEGNNSCLLLKESLEKVSSILDRIDSLVIGPGLGRNKFTMDLVCEIIQIAMQKEIPMVLDGDALFLLAQNPTLVYNYSRIILTPNLMEYARLCHATGLLQSLDIEAANSIPPQDLLRKLGNQITLVKKARIDEIICDKNKYLCNQEGSLRRCGGQGDVLAGCIGTFLAWSSKSTIKDRWFLSGVAGSILTRASANIAFSIHGRSTTTPDVIDSISKAFRKVFQE